MTDIKFSSTIGVELMKTDASDEWVIRAAKVSTKGDTVMEGDVGRNPGKFINFLMEGRHGSPFEHVSFTWLIHQPIFSWREMMRHRIASYNEESGRYKTLEPLFYVPDTQRKLRQEGKPGDYIMVPGDDLDHAVALECMRRTSQVAYSDYQSLLRRGVAREVARMVLPLNIYSSAFVTMNARALMNFLSLRTTSPHATTPSYPQAEIEIAALKMERDLGVAMPHTWNAFNTNGRIAP